MPQRLREIRGTVLSASARGLAAIGGSAEEKGRGTEAPAGREETPAMGQGSAEDPAQAEGGCGTRSRSRQMIARIIAMHGGRVQKGKRDGA